MSTRPCKCTNFGNCTRADTNVVSNIDRTNPDGRCEECGGPLIEVPGKSGGGLGKIALATMLLLLAGGMFFFAWRLLAGGGGGSGGTVQIVSPLEAKGTVGRPFVYTIKLKGTTKTFSAMDLPEGLKIDPASGKIIGTPKTPGVATVSLTAGVGKAADRKKLTLTIAPAAEHTETTADRRPIKPPVVPPVPAQDTTPLPPESPPAPKEKPGYPGVVEKRSTDPTKTPASRPSLPGPTTPAQPAPVLPPTPEKPKAVMTREVKRQVAKLVNELTMLAREESYVAVYRRQSQPDAVKAVIELRQAGIAERRKAVAELVEDLQQSLGSDAAKVIDSSLNEILRSPDTSVYHVNTIKCVQRENLLSKLLTEARPQKFLESKASVLAAVPTK